MPGGNKKVVMFAFEEEVIKIFTDDCPPAHDGVSTSPPLPLSERPPTPFAPPFVAPSSNQTPSSSSLPPNRSVARTPSPRPAPGAYDTARGVWYQSSALKAYRPPLLPPTTPERYHHNPPAAVRTPMPAAPALGPISLPNSPSSSIPRAREPQTVIDEPLPSPQLDLLTINLGGKSLPELDTPFMRQPAATTACKSITLAISGYHWRISVSSVAERGICIADVVKAIWESFMLEMAPEDFRCTGVENCCHCRRSYVLQGRTVLDGVRRTHRAGVWKCTLREPRNGD